VRGASKCSKHMSTRHGEYLAIFNCDCADRTNKLSASENTKVVTAAGIGMMRLESYCFSRRFSIFPSTTGESFAWSFKFRSQIAWALSKKRVRTKLTRTTACAAVERAIRNPVAPIQSHPAFSMHPRTSCSSTDSDASFVACSSLTSFQLVPALLV
jgi:hypothetical protein